MSALPSRLPGPLADLVEEWQLTPDGPGATGHASVVLPVLDRRGVPLVLKVCGPELGPELGPEPGPEQDPGPEQEHLALTRWDGDGAVRLVRADPRRRALLLERLSGPTLTESWDVEACEVIGELYSRLHRPVGAPFRRLSEAVAGPLERLAALPRNAPLPRRLVEQAVSLGRELVAEEAADGFLVHTDLHYANVLRGERNGVQEWLAIGPRPLSGDPTYEVAPLLWTRFDEVAGDVRNGVRRRFHAVVDAAGFDEDRARDWVVVRVVLDALHHLDATGDDRLTRCIAVAKAVQE